MKTLDFQIAEIRTEDKPLVASFISKNWGSQIVVTKGKLLNTIELPGFISILDSKVIGLITYDIQGKDCEIVTLDSKINNHGMGTQLIKMVIEKAKLNYCNRVWLITTNDNTNAIRFYQKRGFDWVGFYKDSLQVSRKIKPEIPEFGDDNIPIKHEIEFELRL
jgi:GNAT superfamily N-acetyltransferase